MSTVRLSHALRLDRLVRYCLLTSLVLALFAGIPAAQVFARPMLAMTYTQSVELTSSTAQANAAIGSPIAISGNTVVLGAPNFASGKGAVYVFNRDPQTGVWDTNPANTVTLTNPTGVSGDNFGYAIAIEDDTIVVGARNQDLLIGGTTVRSAGAVYVFTRTNGVWSLWQGGTDFYAGQARNDQFGSSVAISGNTIAVGVPYEDPAKNIKNAGSVLLFKRGSDNRWSYSTEKQGTTDRIKGDLYGSTLAVEGDTLLVGAPMANGTCGGACGTVSVYSRNQGGTDQWGLLTVIQASPTVGNQYFGKSVAISGSRIVVGAPYATNSGQPGRAYIYNLAGSTASQVTFLTGTTAAGVTGQFGASVAIDGNRIAVGQPYPTASTGAVIVYEDALLNGQWNPIQTLGLTAPVNGDQLGAAVVMSGQTVFAGAPGRTPTGGASDQGAAYIFNYINDGGGTPVTYPPELDLDGTLNGTGFLSTFTVPVAPASLQPAAVVNPNELTITDVDSTDLTSATVTLTNILDAGKESLSATDFGNVHASYNAASGVLTLGPVTGDKAPVSDFQTVLRTVVYSNTSWAPNTTPRLIEFQASDGTNSSNMAVATVFVVRSLQNPVVTFLLNGKTPYHVNANYTVDFTVAPRSGMGAELGVPSGTVQIQVTGGPSCQGTLDAAGKGSCTLKWSSVGSYEMSATYSGNSAYNPATVKLGLLIDYNKLFMPILRK